MVTPASIDALLQVCSSSPPRFSISVLLYSFFKFTFSFVGFDAEDIPTAMLTAVSIDALLQVCSSSPPRFSISVLLYSLLLISVNFFGICMHDIYDMESSVCFCMW